MQDRYVGDVGDFGKYGLLRYLGGKLDGGFEYFEPMRMGVIWYLYPDESHNADGKYTGYLDETPANRASYRACDSELVAQDMHQSALDGRVEGLLAGPWSAHFERIV